MYKNDVTGELYIQLGSTPGSTLVPLAHHRASFQIACARVHLGAAASVGFDFHVAKWLMRRQHGHVWWSLPSLWSGLALKSADSETAGSWMANSIDSWESFIAWAVGGEGQILRSAQYESRARPGRDRDGTRVLPFSSVSTCALVAMLMKWGYGRHRLRRPDGVAKVHEMLAALVKSTPVSWSLPIVLDATCTFSDLGPTGGKDGVCLPIRSGDIKLAALQSAHVEDRKAASWVRKFRAWPDTVPLVEFISVAAEDFQGSGDRVFFRQVRL